MENSKTVPMLFNSDMVNALLEGCKTQTRRPVKMPDGWSYKDIGTITSKHPQKGRFGMLIQRGKEFVETDLIPAPCAVGDLIYVRETFRYGTFNDCVDCEYGCSKCPSTGGPMYAADFSRLERAEYAPWKPSIHMPRSASRITLKVTDVRVEKITSISREDALAEGIDHWNDTFSITPYRNYLKAPDTLHFSIPELSFLSLWDATYKIDTLKEKPWVWVIKFEVIQQNVDDYIEGVSND